MSTEPPRKHAGGRFPKGVSGNPGGKQKRHPEPPAENTPPKHKGGPWPKGVSGNPAGKPKGARHKTTLAMEAMLDGEADAITRKAIELAKEAISRR